MVAHLNFWYLLGMWGLSWAMFGAHVSLHWSVVGTFGGIWRGFVDSMLLQHCFGRHIFSHIMHIYGMKWGDVHLPPGCIQFHTSHGIVFLISPYHQHVVTICDLLCISLRFSGPILPGPAWCCAGRLAARSIVHHTTRKIKKACHFRKWHGMLEASTSQI